MGSITSDTKVRKSGAVGSPAGGCTPDAAALEKIGQYTRRAFRPEELYVFPVVLCDNEVDRDGERFTVNALQKLAELFPGKTGVFDHQPSAHGQTARIYDCRAEQDAAGQTSCGEPYTRLVAQAYLPRTESNRDFITELESGIKKEVSVGCAVRSVTCSVCGADLRGGSCGHERGKVYDGKLCCAVLDDPADAYEWSFVAVPAQRGAGVIKSYSAGAQEIRKTLRETEPCAELTAARKAELLRNLDRLESEAKLGRETLENIRRDFLRYGALAEPEIPTESLRRAAESFGAEDLKSWGAAFRRKAEAELPQGPQLACGRKASESDGNEPFRI